MFPLIALEKNTTNATWIFIFFFCFYFSYSENDKKKLNRTTLFRNPFSCKKNHILHAQTFTVHICTYSLSKKSFHRRKNVKCDLYSRIPTIKIFTYFFIFFYTFYNCTCLRPLGNNSFLIATHITIITITKGVYLV